MNVYSLILNVIFSALVAFFTLKVARYTKEVARYTKEYTEETRHLWKITKNSYFVKVVADHLFVRYADRIKEQPSYWPSWMKSDKALQVFKDDCYRVILDELFPEVKHIVETGTKKLEKEGYKFKHENFRGPSNNK
ncbi:MAG: hypothetical protein ACE5HR_04095 [bacterium]